MRPSSAKLEELLTRQQFLGKCIGSCAAILGISVLASGCATLQYVPAERLDKKIRIKKTDLANHKMVAVRVEGLNKPILIVRKPDHFIALLMECTHKQCELTASSSLLVCPCHGSEFNLDGEVMEGPANQNLISFKITDDEGYLYIS